MRLSTTKTWFLLTLFAILPVLSNLAESAESTKPVVAVSIRSYDALWKGIESIGERMGFKANVIGFKTVLADVQGLDKTKPGGLVVLTDGKSLFPFGFFPVAKFDDLQFMGIDGFKDQLEESKGVKTLKLEGGTVEFLERDGWLYVFEKGKSKQLPAGNPVRWLDGLNNTYILGMKVWINNLSPDLLDTVFSLIRQQMSKYSPQMVLQSEMIKKATDQTLELAQHSVVGLQISDQGTFTTESISLLNPKCDLALKYKSIAEFKSKWTHLYRPETSAFSILLSIPCAKSQQDYQRENMRNTFNNLFTQLDISLDPDDFATAKSVLEPLREFFMDTTKQDKYDGVLSITTDPKIVVGATIPDNKHLIKFITQVDKTLETANDKVQRAIKAGKEKIADYTVNTFVFSFAHLDNQPVPAVIADRELAIYIAHRKDTVICVAGFDKNAVAGDVKKLVTAPVREEKTLPGQASLSIKQTGMLLKNLKIESNPKTKVFHDIVNAMTKADPKATMTTKSLYAPDATLREEFRIDGSVFEMLGERIRESIKVPDKKSGSKKGNDLKEGESLFND